MMHSIKRQIAVMTLALLFFTLLLCWGINNIFLEKIYYRKKQDILMNAYYLMNQASGDQKIQSEEFQLQMEELCDNANLSIMIANSSLKIIYTSVNVYDDTLMMRMFNYVYGDSVYANNNKTTLIERTDNYNMLTCQDERFNTYYMEMVGILDDDNFFIVRTPLESIRENVLVSNRFLGIVALLTTFLGAGCIMYITARVTQPLDSLIEISDQMRQLNFDVKYEGGGTVEMDALGENMNALSSKLEETISDLKTANNELQHDIEQKIQIDEMRKEFLSNVSHELKTPIALIQGYAEGLQECINDDPESRAYYCEVIMDEAAKMNRMVQKLLTLNQIEFGNDVITMERFDITAMTHSLIDSMKLLADQKEAVITCTTNEPVYVWSDEYKIEEVLTNYLSNALNHVDFEKKIEVNIQKLEKQVRVSVFNTGKQIPEEDIDKIWIKFYKVDKARTRAYGGSGIGLSIVKAIMDSLNQSCGAKNYENGVEFWFTLEC